MSDISLGSVSVSCVVPSRLVSISAKRMPTVSVLHEGQALKDMVDYAEVTSPPNYSSTDGAIVSAEVLPLGHAISPDAPLSEGNQAGFSVHVTDIAGNSATFSTPLTEVQYAVRVISTTEVEVEIDRNPIAISGVYTLDFTGSDAPYNGIYPLDLAIYITQPVILATAPVMGTAAVGEELTALDGLAVSEGTSGIENRAYQWYRYQAATGSIETRVKISGATNAAYTIQPNDAGHVLLRGETATDSLGTSAEALTTGTEIPAASLLIADSFTDTDGTWLTAHTADSGQSWVLGLNGSTVPTITSNRLNPNTSSGNAEYYYLSGVSLTDVEVSADISFGGSGGAAGVIARATGTGSTFACYYARLNYSSQTIEMYRLSNGTPTLIRRVAVTETSGAKTIQFRCRGDTLSVDWGGSNVISVTDTFLTGAGSVGIGHYRGNMLRWDNFKTEAL